MSNREHVRFGNIGHPGILDVRTVPMTTLRFRTGTPKGGAPVHDIVVDGFPACLASLLYLRNRSAH